MRKNGNGKNGKNNSVPRIIRPLRVEMNFLRNFIFTFNKKEVNRLGKVAVITRERVYSDGSKTKANLIIHTDWEYGLGGPFDYKAFRTVEKILSDIYTTTNGNIPSGPIYLGKEYSILKMMGYKNPNEDKYKHLKAFFMRMHRMQFNSEFATYNPATGKWAKGYASVEPIYKKVVFTGEEMPEGSSIEKADAVYIWLGDLYKNSLNHCYVALIDFNFYNSIKSLLSRRLYEIISIYAHKHNSVFFWYSDICARMRLKRHKYSADAQRQIGKITVELKKKGFLKSVVWTDKSRQVKLEPEEIEELKEQRKHFLKIEFLIKNQTDTEFEQSEIEKDNTDLTNLSELPDWLIKFEINTKFKAQLSEQPSLLSFDNESQESSKEELNPAVVSASEVVSEKEEITFPDPKDEETRWHNFVTIYIREYKKATGHFPPLNVRDREKMKPIFESYADSQIVKLVKQLFSTTDKYIQKSSRTISFFVIPEVLGKLITEVAEKEADRNNKTLEEQRQISAGKAALTEKDKEEAKIFFKELAQKL
ncbi:hypothetical protein A45J_2697 [hot springs metagenome]|uniref:Replication initiator protein A n=1 Tax=hot springs metagenome TaxID=433727 RepID=A0A5J4L7S0_9ZZZZ